MLYMNGTYIFNSFHRYRLNITHDTSVVVLTHVSIIYMNSVKGHFP